VITKEKFKQAKLNDPYWSDRWIYISKVVDFLKTIEFKTSLELGTNGLSLISTSDTMGIDGEHTYLHDATKPFPIKDKQYDIFIALQVFEHLEGNQRAAFREVMRTSRKALLSFPLEWHCPKDPSHHALTHKHFKEWTLNIEPKKTWVCHARAFYYFEF